MFAILMAVGRKTRDRNGAINAVREFLVRSEIVVAEAGGELLEGLHQAHLLYGKGTDHPAQLNMGDCFSYAMAKMRGVPLLYNGEDFRHTDLG